MGIINLSLSTFPLVELRPDSERIAELAEITRCDWVVVTSPAAAEIFLDALTSLKIDARHIPKIMVAGPGTARVFIAKGIFPNAVPDSDFGAKGIRKLAIREFRDGDRIARVRSDLAAPASELFADFAMKLDLLDLPIYKNVRLTPESLPDFDAALFASSSAVEAFNDNFGAATLDGKDLAVIGEPTLAALKHHLPNASPAIPKCATIDTAVTALVANMLNTGGSTKVTKTTKKEARTTDEHR